MNRPEKIEYNPYYQHYIDLVDEGELIVLLRNNSELLPAYFNRIPIEMHNFNYAPNKWTIKEVLMHITDTERVFAYRTLVCARGDNFTPLHSMDDGLYASNIDVRDKSMQALIDEFIIVRQNSDILLSNLSEAESKFLGNGITHNFTARALGYIMIGHVLHHINIINERYL